jgi:WD40 repeat protein
LISTSHNDGEVWGLDSDGTYVYTSGDDNQVKIWCPAKRECIGTSIVSEHSRKAKRNRASTLGRHPDSQSARSVGISCNGDIAVCANDGHLTIRNTADPATIIKEINDSLEWIEVSEYSPDGKYLAVGSHDTNIYIYDASDGYSLVGKCKKHNATVTCIDWSQDSSVIRSVCNAYELLFFNIPSCSQDPSGASNTTSTIWASHHCKFGWLVDGIFPKGTDGTHINGVDMN